LVVRRGRTNNRPREKRTLIPSFDPEELAREIEQEANRTTIAPPFDPSSYARIVEEHVSAAAEPRDTPRSMVAAATLAAAVTSTASAAGAATAAAPAAAEPSHAARSSPSDDRSRTAILTPPMLAPGMRGESSASAIDDTMDLEDAETVGREMYGSYLASDFPEALVLAERVLQLEPDHALAQLVAERCRERLMPNARTLSPSSVLRLKLAELERQARHIDPTSSFVLGHIDGVSDAATVAALTGLPGGEALERLHALLDLGVVEVVSA
jgi:hypothetical protein